MKLHNAAFWAMSLFLVGVLFGSVGSGKYFVLVLWLAAGLAAAFLLLINKKAAAGLIFAVALGGSYYVFFVNNLATEFTAPIGKQVEFSALVQRVSRTDTGQEVDLTFTKDFSGKIRLYAQPYPTLTYGDVVALAGALKMIEGKSAGYYAKEGIGAIMSFPKKLEITARDEGSKVKSTLFAVRDYVRSSFEKVLPPEEATLMTGLVIGKSSGFSKEFSEKLKITGTTHLVALSGYNIAMIIEMLLMLFGLFLMRKYAVWLCILAVIGFVVMTGAEASVVRAAIMAAIIIFAERSQRTYSIRNAVAFTALAMVLVNPRVLAFDIGFQLSFAALLGIVYLKPAIETLFKVDTVKNPGALRWRENLFTTIAAQLAVLPILITNFGFITPLSIITNVLLLSFIPATMILGVLIILSSLVSSSLAFLFALPARLLLGYELGIIDLFSRINFGFNIENVSTLVNVLCYAALIGFILITRRRTTAV